MFASVAYAAPAGGAGGAAGAVSMFVPLVLMFVVFYFLLIRPQQKRQKQHKEMLSKLQKGDHVITSGGILGRIHEITGDIVTLDLGDSKIRMPRGYISGVYDPKQLEQVGTSAPNAQ